MKNKIITFEIKYDLKNETFTWDTRDVPKGFEILRAKNEANECDIERLYKKRKNIIVAPRILILKR